MAVLNEWFCLLLKYHAKIKGNQPFLIEAPFGTSSLDFKKDKEKVEKGNNDKDIPVEVLLMLKNF